MLLASSQTQLVAELLYIMIFPVNNIIFIDHIIYYASGENFTAHNKHVVM